MKRPKPAALPVRGRWYDGKLQPTLPRLCVAVRRSLSGAVLVDYRLPSDGWTRRCELAAWRAWCGEEVSA